MPAHWDVKRGRHVFAQRNLAPELGDGVVTAFRDGQVTLRENRRSDGFTLAVLEVGYQRVYEGDLVIHGMDAFAGAIGVSESMGKCTPEYSVLTPNRAGTSNHYFSDVLRVMARRNFIFVICPSVRERAPRFRFETFKDISLPVPPEAEQTRIAEFLDRETAKIDELVAEQRRLMELLKEKRRSVIAHAVTRGLNPQAPLKPSGIEWLGDVPAHWSATPIKYVAKVGNGSTPSREVPEYWAESGFPWLNSSVVNSSVVTEPEGYVTERALRECHLPIVAPPAILVGITGQGRTRGMAAMLGIEATINQHIAYVKPSTAALDINYLLKVLESAYLKLRRDSEEAGATKGAITCEQIGNLRVPFPPLAEQSAIVSHLATANAKFDTLTAEAQRAIDLLQERRTALISAAVTGQIDVRHVTYAEPAEDLRMVAEDQAPYGTRPVR
jgi:type I restriction enzyme S subunit